MQMPDYICYILGLEAKHKAFINIVFTMSLACATTVDVLGSG